MVLEDVFETEAEGAGVFAESKAGISEVPLDPSGRPAILAFEDVRDVGLVCREVDVCTFVLEAVSEETKFPAKLVRDAVKDDGAEKETEAILILDEVSEGGPERRVKCGAIAIFVLEPVCDEEVPRSGAAELSV